MFVVFSSRLSAGEDIPQATPDDGAAFDGDPHKPEPMGPIGDSSTMKPYVVSDSPYKAHLQPSEIRLLYLFQMEASYYEFGPFNINMRGSFVATPLRIPQLPKNSAFTVLVLSSRQVRAIPASGVDRAVVLGPEISLVDRGDRLPSESRDTFVSLRGVGVDGSATRVLLDGLPFNDPFDGSVDWAGAPIEGVSQIELVPGGGATAWGNGALGGTVQLFTTRPIGALATKLGALLGGVVSDPSLTKQVVVGTGEVSATFGGLDTRDFEFDAAQPTDQGVFQLLGALYSSGGISPVSPRQKGPIDVNAWSRHEWLDARWRRTLGKNLVLTASIRETDRSEGDGTPYTKGSSFGRFASLSVSGHPEEGFAWNAAAYVQDEGAANKFSYVNSPRTAETPAIDQFAQPATAFGATWSGEWWDPDGSTTSAGADYRHVRGETRDEFEFVNGSYASKLVAGGAQGELGAYFLRDQELSSMLRLVYGTRIDRLAETGGHESESSLGSNSSSEAFASADETEFAPSIGLVWRPLPNWRFHANGQQSYSTPTLSELYQPSGEHSVVTEANPDLKVEHNTSFEVGAEYEFRLKSVGRKPAAKGADHRRAPIPESITLGLTVFSDDLHGAIVDTNIPGESGDIPVFGSLPEGYLARQWTNIDRSLVQGVSLSAQWIPTGWFWLNAAVLFEDPTIRRDIRNPILDGKQMEGVSRSSASLSATCPVSDKLTFTSRLRLLGPQFEDDENTFRLSESAILDLRASYSFTKRFELFAVAENITSSRVETSRGPRGLLYVGAPCVATGGVRISW
jgi:outer membrane receptor protein involved in Fe transport